MHVLPVDALPVMEQNRVAEVVPRSSPASRSCLEPFRQVFDAGAASRQSLEGLAGYVNPLLRGVVRSVMEYSKE